MPMGAIGGGFAPLTYTPTQTMPAQNAPLQSAPLAGANGDAAGGIPAINAEGGGQNAPAQNNAFQQGGGKAGQNGALDGGGKKPYNGPCRTCASRKYQDSSNDPGVSFKSPTAIRPESAATAVMAHEQEHVTRNRQKAGQEGREVIASSVTLHMGICAECHKPYVAGGTTRTTTAAAKSAYQSAMQPAAQNPAAPFTAKA